MTSVNLTVNSNSSSYEMGMNNSSNSYELNASTNTTNDSLDISSNKSTVEVNVTERLPKYLGARAFVTPTEDGAIITLIDYQGETSVEIKNGRASLTIADYEVIGRTVFGMIKNGKQFMETATYDTDKDGIVDNSELVNGHTVEINVPSDAVFTDTQYDSLTSSMIDSICDL